MEDEELVKMFNLTLDLWESLQLSQSFVNTLAHFVLKSWFVSTSLSILYHAGVEFCFILGSCVFVCKWFLILFRKKKMIFNYDFWLKWLLICRNNCVCEWLGSYCQRKRIYGVDLRFLFWVLMPRFMWVKQRTWSNGSLKEDRHDSKEKIHLLSISTSRF